MHCLSNEPWASGFWVAGTATRDSADALRAAEQARGKLRENPRDAGAYRLLGRALRRLGRNDEASEAELAAIEASQFDPEIGRANRAMDSRDLSAAEAILRSVLARRPDDVAALRMLAEIGIRAGHPADAERLLRHALSLAPAFEYARFTLAVALDMLSRSVEAIDELNRISGPLGDQDEFLALKAASLAKTKDAGPAIELYRELVRRQTGNAEIWISIGTLLRFVGDQQGAIDAFRRALEISPEHGDAWWSLASLNTFRFGPEDIAAMEKALGDERVAEADRTRLHFALGKAFEDHDEVERSFHHYRQGNAMRSARTPYDAAGAGTLIEATERLFTTDFLDSRQEQGCKAADPIFIVGLPRSGSTLIEQILASHPLIEGVGELPDIIILAKELAQTGSSGVRQGYPDILRELSAGDLFRLGQTYLDRTRAHRKTARSFFTDKMLNNWFHAGLIRLILPNAKIIDARRHPLACGFSNFRQHYSTGQEFSYNLAHFGSYYRDYMRLMTHFDRVAPGGIYRAIHERLLADPEEEIRKLLSFLGLPFDEACLRFHETERAVWTISAEQVRRPINRSGADQWKRFEPWLEPLKEALGPALEHWAD